MQFWEWNRALPCTVFRKDVSSGQGAARGGQEVGKQGDLSHSIWVPFQLNHFPGSFQIGRKDRLWRNLLRMQARCGKKEFNFFPQSFILPQDIKLLRKVWEEGASRQKWIVKPVSAKQSSILSHCSCSGEVTPLLVCVLQPASARGIGIQVIHKWSQLPKRRPLLVQR